MVTRVVAVNRQSRPKPKTNTADVRASKRHRIKRVPKTRHQTLDIRQIPFWATSSSSRALAIDDESHHQKPGKHTSALASSKICHACRIAWKLLGVGALFNLSSSAPPARAMSYILASGVCYRVRMYTNRRAGCRYPCPSRAVLGCRGVSPCEFRCPFASCCHCSKLARRS